MIERVKKYIRENQMLKAGDIVAAGVSGGADSIAMLHILKSIQEEFGFFLEAVHVHHGIRGDEADRDENLVKKICQEWKIPFQSYHYPVPELSRKWRLGEEETGRIVRKQAFAKEKQRIAFSEFPEENERRFCIALAHNCNDLAETMLHHLARGTGLRGLSGIHPCSDGIIRPVLCLERREIVYYLEENEISYITDSSNLSDGYTRNRIRHHVLEELKTEVGVRWKKIFQEYIKKEHANVLDDGTGAGFFPVILSSLGHCVTAIDYSDEMVEQAKKRFADHGLTVKVQQMDAQHLQFADESFDAIVSRNVLWNLDDPAEAYREMYRVLKPGGTILVEDGNMYLYLHDKDYAKLHDQYVEKQKKKQKADVSLHGKYNVDNVDFSVIEKIAEELPMSCRRRPQWDFDQLVQLGFTDIRVEIQGGALPMGFLIAARKAEV